MTDAQLFCLSEHVINVLLGRAMHDMPEAPRGVLLVVVRVNVLSLRVQVALRVGLVRQHNVARIHHACRSVRAGVDDNQRVSPELLLEALVQAGVVRDDGVLHRLVNPRGCLIEEDVHRNVGVVLLPRLRGAHDEVLRPR